MSTASDDTPIELPAPPAPGELAEAIVAYTKAMLQIEAFEWQLITGQIGTDQMPAESRARWGKAETLRRELAQKLGVPEESLYVETT